MAWFEYNIVFSYKVSHFVVFLYKFSICSFENDLAQIFLLLHKLNVDGVSNNSNVDVAISVRRFFDYGVFDRL